MFKDNNTEDFDLMMKSILDEAREEVPERVWEGVSAGLDKAAGRKTVVLWWRRAAVGIAAAAAVVLGVFFTHNTDNEFIIPAEGDGMIAVVEPETEVAGPSDGQEPVLIQDEPERYILLAEAEEPAGYGNGAGAEMTQVMVPGTADEAIEAEENVPAADEASESIENEAVEKKPVVNGSVENESEITEYFPEDWGEEETGKKRDVAFVLSGITGTNNAAGGSRRGANPNFMSPSVNPAPKKTGIEETSIKSSYGIPLSFGAGVKFGISGRWSVGAGVNYTFLSRQFYGKYTKVTESGGIERVISSDIRNQQHFIGIPVNVFCDIISNDRISFYAYAGGAVEKCISDSYALLNTSIRHKEKAEGVQLSANAGIGVEFMMGKHLGLYIDPSVRYYFDNGQPKSIRTVQPLMLGFEMGLRARL